MCDVTWGLNKKQICIKKSRNSDGFNLNFERFNATKIHITLNTIQYLKLLKVLKIM